MTVVFLTRRRPPWASPMPRTVCRPCPTRWPASSSWCWCCCARTRLQVRPLGVRRGRPRRPAPRRNRRAGRGGRRGQDRSQPRHASRHRGTPAPQGPSQVSGAGSGRRRLGDIEPDRRRRSARKASTARRPARPRSGTAKTRPPAGTRAAPSSSAPAAPPSLTSRSAPGGAPDGQPQTAALTTGPAAVPARTHPMPAPSRPRPSRVGSPTSSSPPTGRVRILTHIHPGAGRTPALRPPPPPVRPHPQDRPMSDYPSARHGHGEVPAPLPPRHPARAHRCPNSSSSSCTLALLLLPWSSPGLSAPSNCPRCGRHRPVRLVRSRGRSLVDWAPIVARYALRRCVGQTALAGPAHRPAPVRDGLLHLPGTAASLRVVTAPDRPVRRRARPGTGTLTAVVKRHLPRLRPARPRHPERQRRRLGARARRAGPYRAGGPHPGGGAHRPRLRRRPAPGTGGARPPRRPCGRAGLQRAGRLRRPGRRSARDLRRDLPGPKAARRLINQAGGGLTGAFTRAGAVDHVRHRQAARTAGLNGHRLADRPRDRRRHPHRLRPQGAGRARSSGRIPGAPRPTPAAAGPVVQVEKADRLATDSARHATYWVENWPRTETSAGFLHGLMFTAGVRRSLSLSTCRRDWSPRCATSSARRPRSSPTPTNAPAAARSMPRRTPSSTRTSRRANGSSSPGTRTSP